MPVSVDAKRSNYLRAYGPVLFTDHSNYRKLVIFLSLLWRTKSSRRIWLVWPIRSSVIPAVFPMPRCVFVSNINVKRQFTHYFLSSIYNNSRMKPSSYSLLLLPLSRNRINNNKKGNKNLRNQPSLQDNVASVALSSRAKENDARFVRCVACQHVLRAYYLSICLLLLSVAGGYLCLIDLFLFLLLPQ